MSSASAGQPRIHPCKHTQKREKPKKGKELRPPADTYVGILSYPLASYLKRSSELHIENRGDFPYDSRDPTRLGSWFVICDLLGLFPMVFLNISFCGLLFLCIFRLPT